MRGGIAVFFLKGDDILDLQAVLALEAEERAVQLLKDQDVVPVCGEEEEEVVEI